MWQITLPRATKKGGLQRPPSFPKARIAPLRIGELDQNSVTLSRKIPIFEKIILSRIEFDDQIGFHLHWIGHFVQHRDAVERHL